MKKKIAILFIINLLFCANSVSQVSEKDTHKAVFQIFTYDKEGKLLKSSNGFFVSEDGIGVAPYNVIDNSYVADIIDYKGEKHHIHRILGANSNYDIVKFSLKGEEKTAWFKIPDENHHKEVSSLNCVSYTGKKKSKAQQCTITKTEDFEDYSYFHLQSEKSQPQMGCPLINLAGEVVAISQKNYDDKVEGFCAIDARFVHRLNITEKSAFDADVQKLNYPTVLPNDEAKALTYLYMIGFRDSIKVSVAIEDFINLYPDNTEIYVHKGNFHAKNNDFIAADQAYAIAFEKSEQVDDVHYKLSKLIFNKVLQQGDSLSDDWNLSRAASEAAKAHQLNPQAHYALQEAHCLFYMKKYADAYQKYLIACQTAPQEWAYRTKAENWFYAVGALELSGASATEVASLMDSVVAVLPRPIQAADAPYLLERAQRLQAIKEYRKAVTDYNDYELAIGHSYLNDRFYYIRSQAELNAHMYQQALDDIRTAISRNPNNEIYRVEEASILLRVGMFDEAIEACENSLQRLPENPDCYKIIGVAYYEKGEKKKGLAALQKAVSLGDETANDLIKSYQQ